MSKKGRSELDALDVELTTLFEQIEVLLQDHFGAEISASCLIGRRNTVGLEFSGGKLRIDLEAPRAVPLWMRIMAAREMTTLILHLEAKQAQLLEDVTQAVAKLKELLGDLKEVDG